MTLRLVAPRSWWTCACGARLGVEERQPLQLVDRRRVLPHRVEQRAQLARRLLQRLRLVRIGVGLADGAEDGVPTARGEAEQLVPRVRVAREVVAHRAPVVQLVL